LYTESLKNQGIIREANNIAEDIKVVDPSPQPDLGNMTVEQMRRELRRRREAEAEVEGDRRLKVKQEPKGEPRRLIVKGLGETVDLTGED